MRVLGIDPGSAVTGFGVVSREDGCLVHVAHGTVRPPRQASLAVRLDHLYCGVQEVIALHAPDVAAVEQVFVAASPRSALVLGQARGAVLAALAGVGLIVSEYSATQTKQAVTGSGRAAKRQVQAMVRRLLELQQLPGADASDALAAAICHIQSAPLRQLGRLPGRGTARGRRHPAGWRRSTLRVRRAP